jgi:hypothetical protein
MEEKDTTSSNQPEQPYIHLLQKAGVLKNFSVAKVVNKKEIEELRRLIQTVAKDEKEFNQMFAEEMAMIGNLHDKQNPIPGIIYLEDRSKNIQDLVNIAKSCAKRLREEKTTRKELCFIVAVAIKELGLTQEDFLRLNEDDDYS